MISLRIDMLDLAQEPSERIATVSFDMGSGSQVLSPEVLWRLNPEVQPIEEVGINASVYGSNTMLVLSGFEYLSLAAFANSEASFPSLRIYGAKNFFRLNDLSIKRLDSESSNALVCDCSVGEFNVGIEENHQRQLSKESACPSVSVSTDIRGGLIDRIRIFVPQLNVYLQRCGS